MKKPPYEYRIAIILAITTTTEDWVKRAKEVHGGRYDYADTIYVGSAKPIQINCLVHGIFVQKAC